MIPRRSDEAPIEQTAERVARFVATHISSPAPAGLGEKEFLRRLSGFRQVRGNVRWSTLGVAMAAVLVVIGLVTVRYAHQIPAPLTLSYRLDNQDPPSDGYILVPQAAESVVSFSDGSKVRLEAQTRGRVLEVNQRGATFTLEDGRVLVDIVPRSRAQWIFKAGPFRVNVHGTSFAVAWNPHHGVFEVNLTSGSISVASPIGGPEIQVHEGQSLRVSLQDQTSTLEPTRRREVVAAADTAVAMLDAAGSASSEPLQTAPAKLVAPSGWSQRGWMAVLSENKAADVVADADRRGVMNVLEQADSDDLWALANAARYAGRYPLANEALLAQRRRFPSSERAREAAFLLGRLHDGDPDGPGKAIGWYDRYLMEAREDANASDALGRKMTLLQRWHRSAYALEVARDYLRRFPRGTYANAARALVQSATAVQ